MSIVSPIQYPADKIPGLLQGQIAIAPKLSFDFARRGNLLHGGAPVTYSGNGGTSMVWGKNATLVGTTDNEPRFAHDPVTGVPRGWLIEGAVTKILLQTEDFETTWTSPGANTTFAKSSPAPDGENTATDILHDDNNEVVRQTVTVVANTVYTLSFLVHSGVTGAHDWVQINYFNGTKGIQAWFDLTNNCAVGVNQTFGTGATLIGTNTEDLGDGWYIISITGQLANNVTGATIELHNQTADGDATEEATNSVLWWAAGLEPGAFATSYVPVTTVGVERTADVNSADIASQLGSENTVVVAARTGYGPGVVVQIDDGTENERYRIERNSSDEIHVIVTDGGVDVADLNLGAVANQTDFKVAARFAANNIAASLDGAAVVKDTSAALPTVDTLRHGMDTTGNEWGSTIKRSDLYDSGEPDSFLQSIAA